MVERQLPKLYVDGSIPFARSKMLVSVGLDNVVRFSDVAGHKEIAALAGHQRRIHFVTFAHAGAWVATAGMDRTVKLWNIPKEPTGRVSE